MGLEEVKSLMHGKDLGRSEGWWVCGSVNECRNVGKYDEKLSQQNSSSWCRLRVLVGDDGNRGSCRSLGGRGGIGDTEYECFVGGFGDTEYKWFVRDFKDMRK